MTKKFDDKSRDSLSMRLFGEDLEHNGSKVSSLVVKKTTVSFAREYIATYHYTKTMPDSTMFCFAGWYGEVLAGVIVFGMGSGKNQYTALIPDIENGQYLELTRMWSPDSMPRNTESKLIMSAISMLPKEIKLIVSFADPSRGHVGTIYQATNFIYCGMSAGGKVLVTSDGIEKHPRLLGIYKMRHPELKEKSNSEIMKKYGWVYGVSAQKYRYIMLRGDKREKRAMMKTIKDRILPYPKKCLR